MGYTLTQINTVLSKADRAIHILGSVAYNKKFAELDETYWYDRDIIFTYKTAVEWGKVNDRVGDPRMDFIVERLEAMMEIYDYGSLTPIYSQVAQVTGVNTVNFITEETDPTVPAWVKLITESDIDNWDESYTDRINSLTTIGSSGTATLINNILNIPNYGSALSAYVPYTGATGDVNLGVYTLNANSINIIGPGIGGNGGGYLGLKQSASVIYGGGGYTSLNGEDKIYLTMYFSQDLTGTNYKLAKFNVSALTNNTPRIYSLPNASGTLALTSDITNLTFSAPLVNTAGVVSIPAATSSVNGYLSSADWTTFNNKQAAGNYVTLDTYQTITASKTFSVGFNLASVGGTNQPTFFENTSNLHSGSVGSNIFGFNTNNNIYFGKGSDNGGVLQWNNSEVRYYTLPNANGTLALTSQIPSLTGYVPYTGATTNVDLGEYELKAGQLTLDISPTGTAAVGTTRWNNTIGSSETTLKGGNVILKNGVDLVARVVNKVTPNTTLTKAGYAAVRVSGASGQRLAVAYAQANNDNNSADTIGLVTETIATNQEGFIMTVGQLLDINTTGSLQGETWADGDVLYLSPTTPGALTNVKPNGSTGHIVVMGYVEYAHANHGSIYVKVMNGWELDELHNVYISSVANNQGLFYESSTQLWKNKSIATVLGYTPANAATTITINGTTYDISTNRTWSVGTVTSIGTSGPITGGTITGSGTIGITQATTSTNGYLSSTDWNTFYNKQAAGSYITALTGEATASGPGSASVTLSTSAVTGKLLTGLNLTGGGSIAATDSILQAFGKVQNQISGLAGGVTYQGTWNASTNTPTLTSSTGTKGYYYIVDVAGSTNLNGITDWKVGDWAIFNGSTWDKVDNTDAVSSVNGFTGAVSLTTSNISEGTNLYYLDSRARLALSFTAGSGGYNNTTGVITIPTNTSQLTNGANFITLSSLSASSPLAYNSGTGAFSIQVATGAQNGYLSSTDWTTFNGKQNALTLTTTGSSGSATLVGATLNIPTYTLSGLGGVPTSRQLTINGTAYDLSADRSWSVGTHTGSLTSGYVPKATGSTTLTDGLLYDTGSAVLLGTQTAGSGKFLVYSSTADNHYQAIGTAPSFRFADTITSPTYTGIVGLATASNHFIIGAAAGDMVLANNTSSVGNFLFGTGATERMRINATTGNVSIGNTGNTFKLEVTGTTKISGQLTLGSTITNGTYTYTLPSATGTIALVGGSGVGTVTSIATTGPITGGTITSTGTIGITQSGAASDGYLSSTDWNTFNNKQSALTNPVTGTGTTNYLPKFTGTSTIGNSIISESSGVISVAGNIQTDGNANRYVKSTGFISNQLGQLSDFGGSDAGYYFVAGGGIQFVSGGANRMLLNSSGNLGLGVTPSASQDPAIESRFGIYIGKDEVNALNNAYFNSGFKYIQSGFFANRYYQDGYNGGHKWYIAPSGTAGNAISFTQAMTLNASGNLSIGNTNDTYKLDVSGTGRFIVSSTSQNQLRVYSSDGTATLKSYSTSDGDGLILNQYYAVAGNPYLRSADFVASMGDVSSTQMRFFTKAYSSNPAVALTLASTGAATFSNNVTIGTGTGQANIYLNRSATTSIENAIRWQTNGTSDWYLGSAASGSNSDLEFYNYGIGAVNFKLSRSTGAATFSYTGSFGNNLTVAGDYIQTTNSVFKNTTYELYLQTDGVKDIVFRPATVEKMRLQVTTGNLGIGTTSPTNKLTIQSNSTQLRLETASDPSGYYSFIESNYNAANPLNIYSSAAASYVLGTKSFVGVDTYLNSYYNLALCTGATTPTTSNIRMFIANGGNVGIGTTSPSYQLDLGGSGTTNQRLRLQRGTDDSNQYATYGWNQINVYRANVSISSTQTDFSINQVGSDGSRTPFYISTAGNVGIGTTSPDYKLQVSSATKGIGVNEGNIVIASNESLAANIGGSLGFGATSDYGLLTIAKVGGYRENATGTSASSYLAFETRSGGNAVTERMRITSGGNVGINTTSPSYLLDVNGTARFGSAIVANLGTGLVYSSGGTLTSTNPSDQRLKNTIKPLSYGLNEILQLNPKTFYYNDDVNKERLKYGFIAHEVKDVMPDLARKIENSEYLGLETEGIWVTLVNAIKESHDIIDKLKERISVLEQK